MLRTLAYLVVAALPLLAEKRPLTHKDYDSWRHIQNQQLSGDGRYLAYAVFPQVGDGEIIIRDLSSGTEVHQPAGELPPPPPPNNVNPQLEEAPPAPPGIGIKFSADDATAVFLSFPTHAEMQAARRAKKKPAEMPKGELVVVRLGTSQVSRTPKVVSFQLPSESKTTVAYLQESETAKELKPNPESEADFSAVGADRPPTFGDLMVRDLTTGTERRFPQVSDYSLLKDASLLVAADREGVFAVRIGSGGEPTRLLASKGRRGKLSWNERETRLAFVSGNEGSQPGFQLYTWDKQSPTAVMAASPDSPGFPNRYGISEKAPVTLSKTGRFIFFGTALESPKSQPKDTTPADEKVSVDLWSWNDDHIQPMQKVRAATERARSYRAVVDTRSKKFVQLADPSLPELVPAEDGSIAIGNDDREYRRMQEYDDRFEDSYLVDTVTGKRTPVAKRHLGRVSWSPDSQHAVFFNGKDWILINALSGTTRNLTSALPVPFGREVYDQPSKPPAEGTAIWTNDGKAVVLYDRFDVWRCPVDSGSPVNLTRSFGRNHHVAFRIVRAERDDPADRYLDPSKPIILRAENEDTRETGFYRLERNADPVQLRMAARNYAPPIKARHADVYVTAESNFSEYPDLQVTDGTFRDLKKVSNVGLQVEQFAWGSAELMQYENADGLRLNGTLYKPANFDPSKRYPMIVYIYERLSQNVNLFVEPRPTNTINVSYYTSNGYVVLEPDIAYKIGYPGQSAMRCVLPAVQNVVNRGFVDEKNIGIQGHSWGGYQIAYMVTQTDRFKAAAPGAPVANMISAYDGIRWGPGIPRQFQYERTQSRIGGTPWEYPLRYIENSPIFMVDRIHTPLLMIHNDADDAVPWYQGIEYFLALRRLNKEAYLFSYNGEPHNLRRRPNQKDYTLRLQQFFDYYLKGAAKPAWMEHGIPFIHKDDMMLATDDESPDEVKRF